MQVTACVRWTDSVQWVVDAAGEANESVVFMACGAAKGLRALTQRSLPRDGPHTTDLCQTVEDVKRLVQSPPWQQ